MTHPEAWPVMSLRNSILNIASLRYFQEFTVVGQTVKGSNSNDQQELGQFVYSDQSGQTARAERALSKERIERGTQRSQLVAVTITLRVSRLSVSLLLIGCIPTPDLGAVLFGIKPLRTKLRANGTYLPAGLTLYFTIIFQPRKEKLHYHPTQSL